MSVTDVCGSVSHFQCGMYCIICCVLSVMLIEDLLIYWESDSQWPGFSRDVLGLLRHFPVQLLKHTHSTLVWATVEQNYIT